MQLVPTRRTVLSTAEAIDAFHLATRSVVGGVTPASLAVLLAQSALETGRWRSLWCFNFGNEKPGRGYAGAYYMIRCNEYVDGALRWFDPPDVQTWFRAFESARRGCEAHVAFLSKSERYHDAWQEALAGDPAAFVHALKKHGYFTASEDAYLRSVVQLFNELLPAVHAAALDQAEVTPLEHAPGTSRSPLSDADLEARLLDIQWDTERPPAPPGLDNADKDTGKLQ